MSSSKEMGGFQDERGKKCVDEDLTTECESLEMNIPCGKYESEGGVCTGYNTNGKNTSHPWLALNLGGIQAGGIGGWKQRQDISKVEVTVGRKTDATFRVLVANMKGDSCFRNGYGPCDGEQKGQQWGEQLLGGYIHPFTERAFARPNQRLGIYLMGEKSVPNDGRLERKWMDGEKFSISLGM